ncbi:MAG: type II toxin-antitoxin system VapC family toxin [Polyangiaceae bacterium]|nr:type II toxin-antitoxin system VapC family toxin [Polyangiaceae bacterium]
MKLLLDTCAAIWLAAGDARLSATARAAFRDADNTVALSAASAWEIAVKHRLGRLPLPEPPDAFVRRLRETHAIDSLPIDELSALGASRLPDIHRDPFDRIIVCQAIAHGFVLVTDDAAIRQYPVRTLW